jgi:hypothetical protein
LATTPESLAKTLMTVINDTNEMLSERALAGLAGHIFHAGLFPTQELVYRLGGSHELLEQTCQKLNSVFSAAVHHQGEAIERVRRFLVPLTSGDLIRGLRDASPHGTLWEMDILHLFYSAFTSNRNKIHLPNPGGQLGPDLILELAEQVGRLGPGRWLAECKAYYPLQRWLENYQRKIYKQFVKRAQDAANAGAPLDFVYFFRGPYQREFAEILVDAVMNTPFAPTRGVRVLNEGVEILSDGDWVEKSGDGLRMLITFAGIPQRELSVTVRGPTSIRLPE